ncbi:hypothetical protein NGRA_2827 [Nosema granulosis]|uniref:Uncharacterized protein n=1 Tax=Nosema granulosis TaxID=83296 RepID=A0A9P6GX06_9MICR|nr:hypothetical protein NGRA_2827 [Nosema granulosis]
MEAWKEQSAEVNIENDENGEYASIFKRRFREEFAVDQVVIIARRENLGTQGKTDKGRFIGVGRIVARCENDSYLVRSSEGKMVKKRHYDLKELRKNVDFFKEETNRLEGGCGV